jgi:enoyl-CoA hydratase/carnithine racemase
VSTAIHCYADSASHVGHVVIRRPEKRNAFTPAMVRTIGDALVGFGQDDDVKVVVIRPEGADLTTGLDAVDAERVYQEAPGGAVRKVPSQRARALAQSNLWWGPTGLYHRVLHCPKITVLQARGWCLDVGLNLSLCCDLVIADDSARFGQPRWQHIGVDGDVTALIAAVGLKRANEMMFCGPEWDAKTALGYGLIDKVVRPKELEEAVMTLATLCGQVMRDGIVTEKHYVFASLAKMHIGTGMAIAAVMGGYGTNLHFRDREFNFLRETRAQGVKAALIRGRDHFGLGQ